jgi:hypothetical protein
LKWLKSKRSKHSQEKIRGRLSKDSPKIITPNPGFWGLKSKEKNFPRPWGKPSIRREGPLFLKTLNYHSNLSAREESEAATPSRALSALKMFLGALAKAFAK